MKRNIFIVLLVAQSIVNYVVSLFKQVRLKIKVDKLEYNKKVGLLH
jgi:hypothetical protein